MAHRTLALPLLALLFSACATALPAYRLTVRGLKEPDRPGSESGKVSVAVSAITAANWREHPGMYTHAEWTASNMSSYAHSTGTDLTSFDVSSRSMIQSADLPLLPLPSFIIRIVNHGATPIRFGPSRIWLEDDRGHRFRFIDNSAELSAAMSAQFLSRFPDLGTPNNLQTREGLRQAVERLPLLTSARVIAPGADWQGFVVFDLSTRDQRLMRDFMLHAARLTLGVDAGTPLTFHFEVERAAQAIRCPTGTPECLHNDTTLPLANGPCVQRTIKPRSMGQVQWWMGDTPVANSDVQRTLAADPLTHTLARRGLILRGVGYGLIGLGLISAALSTPLLAHYYGPYIAPAGVSFVGLSIVGAVIGVAGVHRTDEALRLYNVQAGATGMCVPVW